MSITSHKILVFDDDPDISLMLKMMLEYKGYSVTTTERAAEVHALLENNPYDLVIMDMLLSGTNGTDVCAAIKQKSSIPIMMISAHPNAREICLQAGADEFISKPFDMQEILGKISKIIG